MNVAIVGAEEIYPARRAPNPFDIKCPSTTYVLNDCGTLSACINGPAFLLIEFNNSDCPSFRPAFRGPASCNNCTQYNIYPGSAPGGEDLCVVLTPFGVSGVIMYVDANCCQPTPTLPESWGLVKTLYR
ncbi:MAG: hypothetical protein AAB290_05100 [Candidatus Eisenbacteria bacterium]